MPNIIAANSLMYVTKLHKAIHILMALCINNTFIAFAKILFIIYLKNLIPVKKRFRIGFF